MTSFVNCGVLLSPKNNQRLKTAFFFAFWCLVESERCQKTFITHNKPIFECLSLYYALIWFMMLDRLRVSKESLP